MKPIDAIYHQIIKVTSENQSLGLLFQDGYVWMGISRDQTFYTSDSIHNYFSPKEWIPLILELNKKYLIRSTFQYVGYDSILWIRPSTPHEIVSLKSKNVATNVYDDPIVLHLLR